VMVKALKRYRYSLEKQVAGQDALNGRNE
jgi:hypothetical protein